MPYEFGGIIFGGAYLRNFTVVLYFKAQQRLKEIRIVKQQLYNNCHKNYTNLILLQINMFRSINRSF